MQSEEDRRKLVMSFGLEEDPIPVKDEMIEKEKENVRKLLKAMDLPNASLAIKEAEENW